MSAKLWRDVAAVTIGVTALLLGLLPLTITRYQPGITLGVDVSARRLIVMDVDPWGPAAEDGVTRGMVVLRMNDMDLIDLPHEIYSEPGPDNPDNPDASAAVKLIGVEPAVPTPKVGLDVLNTLVTQQIESLDLIDPAKLAAGSAAEGYPSFGVFYPGRDRLYEAGHAIIPGIAILLFGSWWLASGRAGPSLRELAFPLAAAVAVPLLGLTLSASGTPPFMALGGLLSIVGMLPLAFALAGRVSDGLDRRYALVSIAVCAAAAAVFSITFVVAPLERQTTFDLRWIVTAAIPFVPGVIAAGPINTSAFRSRREPGPFLRSTELAVAGATPAFALVADRSPFVWPLAVWLLAIFVAARFTVRPLARLAMRATLQRDLVVAATEAERARLAADIHDEALQELTLLVRRLEASGDTEGAEIGRTVADRLRAICGDLRLPILDDLGVGPALDWLVLRIERLAGGEVRLERADDARHSPDVELAIFRVAQEALANAVKHGRPPIVVRYRSTAGGISLAVDDAGPGISDQAPADAEQAGRFGLLNMAQRAEQIGAILDVKRWPSGGTHVALEWRPR
jgi:signal transduction histidine kinase